MGLFRTSKRSRSPSDSLVAEHVISISSSESVKSTSSGGGKIKSLFSKGRKRGSSVNSIDSEVQKGTPSHCVSYNIEPPKSPSRLGNAKDHNYKKRVSTIIENNYSDGDGNSVDESENGSEVDSFDSELEEEDDDDDDEEEEEEDHLHPLKPKYGSSRYDLGQQLSTIMGYCGLKRDSAHSAEQANNESKKTYSLLDPNTKIRKISLSAQRSESVIGEYQIRLIRNLTLKLQKLMTQNVWALLEREKSLYQRYGVVRDVIGKGTYGIIKVVDPNTNGSNGSGSDDKVVGKIVNNMDKTLYAVKELARKKDEKIDLYIQRILSEFVISSTLNNKHINESFDLMGTKVESGLKISQVMQCSRGGDLFSYILTGSDVNNNPVTDMSLYEVDCFAKQIAKGLKYMHSHGVSHCDLKLENILLSYENCCNNKSSCATKILLKLSDFGKSFVFRSEMDKAEQMLSGSQGLIGSQPYISPEEFVAVKTNQQYSSVKKDIWAFGILVLVLLNVRRHYYRGSSHFIRRGDGLVASDGSDNTGAGYLWKTTELKYNANGKNREFKDKVFNEYTQKRLIADYHSSSKEWTINREASFPPIDDICQLVNTEDFDKDTSSDESVQSIKNNRDGDDELDELRVMIIYKLLDMNPATRMSMDEFLKSDWMTATEACF
ncbi:HAL5 [Candida oxycetoniae]|uniref:non-specific serine/threonine protein kinase n=1 Tax=Candida oxycetoniae TaxID=497107 RepID=A0AAI9WW95_9ASCO|nr:HAL5 [Candida oxycetoniae]KAI3402797.2 HAL5 [Candida oxycetoniae]